ncbi:MAG: hypothetical protein AB8B62_18590 [Roseobacter sp.]
MISDLNARNAPRVLLKLNCAIFGAISLFGDPNCCALRRKKTLIKENLMALISQAWMCGCLLQKLEGRGTYVLVSINNADRDLTLDLAKPLSASRKRCKFGLSRIVVEDVYS